MIAQKNPIEQQAQILKKKISIKLTTMVNKKQVIAFSKNGMV
jgi:hypothetical protein